MYLTLVLSSPSIVNSTLYNELRNKMFQYKQFDSTIIIFFLEIQLTEHMRMKLRLLNIYIYIYIYISIYIYFIYTVFPCAFLSLFDLINDKKL